MIYRHCIAPPRAYTQFSHDIIRHPRLSSDAVRLLTWQLSLPQGTRESLSRTAERANIGACAFTRAKRQLKDEGFVHERRVQGPADHWVTQQLVSNVPLIPAEAAKLLARMPVLPPQVAPSPRNPTAGERTGRLTDGLPYGDTYGNTHNHPPQTPRGRTRCPRIRALLQEPYITLVEVTRRVGLLANDITAERPKIKGADAVHLACACFAKVDVLMTRNFRDFKPDDVYRGVLLRVPFEFGGEGLFAGHVTGHAQTPPTAFAPPLQRSNLRTTPPG
ncbi:hypothetical protein [Streptomyces cellostaticus]|uniref:hypothetical protein n=1 Tax=Streptomyces cellostaticus TaxID=67285 RepID=UPI0020266E53|nr:hypothetical protein [Streptomyces cellostaticus]